jgi:beta-phosphoglucomutase
MSKKNDDYLSHIAEMDAQEILPDVPKVLDYLTQEKQAISLGSASKNARMILKKVHLINQFDVIVDGNDVIKGKPNPEVFLKAAKELNTAAKDCIVFEDSVAGIQAANAANMISIGIGDKEILHEADYIFNDFTEIGVGFIKELIKEKKM